MRIQKARGRDVSEIISLNEQLILPFKSQSLELLVSKYIDKKLILEQIESGYYYILKDIDTVGALCLFLGTEDAENEAYIESLAVRKDDHNKGYGRKLVDFSIDKSMREGMQAITVDSFVVYDVKDFYIKCGFKLNPKLKKYNGHKLYSFYMDL